MKKFILTSILLVVMVATSWAQTTSKFGYSWLIPSGWESDKIDKDEIYLTPKNEKKTVSFVSIKVFPTKDEATAYEEAGRFMLRELGTKDEKAFDDAKTEMVNYNGVDAALMTGAYLNDDLEFTDYKALLIFEKKRIVIVMGSVWDGGDMMEAAQWGQDIDYILQSTKKSQ
ncbi:MAG TPA: hypothetical protein DCM08_11490 [Microscillaceae bacterium]|jgi:hypothetical protein|nr:hypothetical protein [Microscillaceae bacterium]